ncbi:hypothetical protein LTR85_008407 [Meristemomyces frigidus]|nr:hypothetical protein LTR85_008407 [Meristemomyces frigidus]
MDGFEFTPYTSLSWEEAKEKHNRKIDDVCGHHQGLQDGLKKLRALTNGAVLPTEQIDTLLNQLQDQADGIKAYLTESLGQVFAAGAATEESTAKAQEVFNSPELLEMIMMQLHPRHILVAQRVNKTFEALISTSPKVQQYLGLRADATSAFATAFRNYMDGWPSFTCRSAQDMFSFGYSPLRRETEPDPDAFEIRASFSPWTSSAASLPKLGDRCLSMLVCQPPIFEMQACVSCCDRHRYLGHPFPPDVKDPEPLRSKTGITVGDVLKATSQLIDRHRTCPHASQWDHDEHGLVNVSPSFKGVLRLKDSDPSLRAQQKYRQRIKDQMAGDVDKDRRMTAYITAKRQAQTAGAAIPTLEEFTARNDGADGQ